MNRVHITEGVQRLSQAAGVYACALVDASSGMVWQASGAAEEEHEPVWEAAADYWRVRGQAQDSFSALGPLHVVLAFHAKHVLAILPCRCEPELLMVYLARHHHVDWNAIQREVRDFSHTCLPQRGSAHA
jgi:hypothetical protein